MISGKSFIQSQLELNLNWYTSRQTLSMLWAILYRQITDSTIPSTSVLVPGCDYKMWKCSVGRNFSRHNVTSTAIFPQIFAKSKGIPEFF